MKPLRSAGADMSHRHFSQFPLKPQGQLPRLYGHKPSLLKDRRCLC
eukprot:CAMPEP_0172886102 /NCGR_PEP_ID=MMETSP1075-20121228/130017_1 /TAXON_ID=2916 /ORGANISM="Ceratium fusus, Strain PA161109" /LENGTH=45 /DNA_ID= /DNA_START= /DNA_END= /DNA_ORIENTATION=